MSEQHEQAARLLAELSPRDAVELLAKQHNARLQEAEQGKEHPLKAFSLPAEEWAAFKAYLTDGGGVFQDADLRREVHQALFDDDQAAFWPGIAHLWKVMMREKGNLIPLPNGGVSHAGVGPAPIARGEA